MPKEKKEQAEEQSTATVDPPIDPDHDPELDDLESDAKKEKMKLAAARNRKLRKKYEREEAGEEVGQVSEREASYRAKFALLLDADAYRVSAERRKVSFKGLEIPKSLEVYHTPIALEELEMDLQEKHGGGTWVLRVQDEDMRFRGTRNLTISGDPVIPEGLIGLDDDEDDGHEDIIINMDDDDDDEVKHLRKQIKIERLQKDLKRAQGIDEGNTSEIADLIQKMDENHRLEMSEIRHKAEMDVILSKVDNTSSGDEIFRAENERLKDQVVELKQDISELKQEISEEKRAREYDQKLSDMQKEFLGQGSGKPDSNVEMLKLLASGKDEQSRMLMELIVNNNKKDNPAEEMKAMVETMAALRTLVADQTPPESVTGALIQGARDVIPTIIGEVRESREAKSQAIRDGVRESMEEFAANARTVPAQAVPAQGSPAVQPQPQPQTPYSGVTAEPDFVGNSPSDAVGVPTGPSSEEMMSSDNTAAARQQRVNNVLATILQEIEMRPKAPTWAAVAWEQLPEDILEGLIYAKGEMDVYNAIKSEGDPNLIQQLTSSLMKDKDARDFLIAGVNAIKKRREQEMEEAQAEEVQTEEPQIKEPVVSNDPVMDDVDEQPAI